MIKVKWQCEELNMYWDLARLFLLLIVKRLFKNEVLMTYCQHFYCDQFLVPCC